jgi:hypothetical protein
MSREWKDQKNRPMKVGLYGFWSSFPEYQPNYPILGLLESTIPIEVSNTITEDTDVVICSLFGERTRPAFLKDHFTVMCVGEPYMMYPQHQLWGDYQIGFLPNDSDHLYFPLWQQSLTYYDGHGNFIINEKSRPLIKKTKFCANFSSHDSTGIRTQLCDIVGLLGSIDYYGSWRNNQPIDRMLGATDLARAQAKFSVLDHYKFSVCPENSIQPYYLTEKLPEAMLANTIPIYAGDPNLNDTPFNQKRMITISQGGSATDILQKMFALEVEKTLKDEPIFTRTVFPQGMQPLSDRLITRILEQL